ncbi:MAG: efflux RND transporter periplasmic adaptor subunit [Candidatus Latescibacteria bacterium]|nr:efflux RND transporter periplasmic adaptor subunit [Candidatus Latescibacterota bacterium]
MKKVLFNGMFLVVLLLILSAGCGKESQQANINTDSAVNIETETNFTKVTNVEIYTVVSSSFEDYITLPVVVKPNKEVNLGLTSGGKVTKIYVDKGDRVSNGMTLLETDDVLLKAVYDQAKANLDYQKTEFERSTKLLNDGTITEAQYDGAKLQLATAQSSFDMAKKQFEDSTLKAPFAGLVTVKNVEVGDILSPGSPAFRIIDMSQVKVQAGIPEKHIVLFKEGNTVSIRLDAIPEKVFNGRINYISPEASTSVRTFLAEINIHNSEGLIRAGTMGNAQILRQIHANAIMIPLNALVESQKGRSVFVARDDKTAEERTVQIGSANDTMIRIINGINPGDRVIVKGQQDLVTGEKINVTGEYIADLGEGTVQ